VVQEVERDRERGRAVVSFRRMHATGIILAIFEDVSSCTNQTFYAAERCNCRCH
jgi:hypothetical protein